MRETDSATVVALPGGDIVEVTRADASWWHNSNASGYVPPELLAPDPKNPRQTMRGTRLLELKESIAARGVRQQIIVTLRKKAPWVVVAPEHKHCPLVIVSGHRRQYCALEAKLPAVPVKVVVYANEMEHRMDMSLLNKGQDDLTALEEGFEIVNLRNLDWKIDQLCAAFGYQAPQLYMRTNLTLLHPDLQERLGENTPKDRLITTTLGGALGGIKTPTPEELEVMYDNLAQEAVDGEYPVILNFDATTEDERRFALQKLLLSVSRARGMSSTRAIQLVKDHALNLTAHHSAGGRKPERYQPRKRMELLNGLLSSVEGSMVVDWKHDEWQRILANASREEVQALFDRLTQCSDMLRHMADITRRVLSTKRETSPEVIRLMQRPRDARV
ncbi:hypothetical protein FJY94_03695 [Candidatus Kaiserbacteria bacterium]|nr:hypothetical protein [Candidatus Kaiserbacteria bacterium]